TGWGADQRSVALVDHRDEDGQIRTRARLGHRALFELRPQPLSIKELTAWWIPPRSEVGVHHDGQLDRPSRPAAGPRPGDIHEAFYQCAPLGWTGTPAGDDEHVDVAPRPQPAAYGGAVQVRTDGVWRQHPPHHVDDVLQLAHRQRTRVEVRRKLDPRT